MALFIMGFYHFKAEVVKYQKRVLWVLLAIYLLTPVFVFLLAVAPVFLM
jgi:hypothetical protein